MGRADRAFRRLLRLFPADFRGDFGDDMAQTFHDQRVEIDDRGGGMRHVRLWWDTIDEICPRRLLTSPRRLDSSQVVSSTASMRSRHAWAAASNARFAPPTRHVVRRLPPCGTISRLSVVAPRGASMTTRRGGAGPRGGGPPPPPGPAPPSA